MKYYVMIQLTGDDIAPDTYKIVETDKEKAFRLWQDTPGSVVVKDVKFKIVEEV